MAHNNSFEVIVSGSTSADDYCHAMVVPKSKLPELNAQQKFVVKKLGVSSEEYRRGVLADSLGERRSREYGTKLGEIVQEVLDESGSGYQVEVVREDIKNFQWLVRIGLGAQTRVMWFHRTLVHDAVDSDRPEARERVKAGLLDLLREEKIAGQG